MEVYLVGMFFRLLPPDYMAPPSTGKEIRETRGVVCVKLCALVKAKGVNIIFKT